MTYELAKRLKDAGFPQKVSPTPCHYKSFDGAGNTIWIDLHTREELVYRPSLSELIAECGDSHIRHSGHFTLQYNGHWQAGYMDTGGFSFGSIGDTPEEAVAELYIAITNANKL